MVGKLEMLDQETQPVSEVDNKNATPTSFSPYEPVSMDNIPEKSFATPGELDKDSGEKSGNQNLKLVDEIEVHEKIENLSEPTLTSNQLFPDDFFPSAEKGTQSDEESISKLKIGSLQDQLQEGEGVKVKYFLRLTHTKFSFFLHKSFLHAYELIELTVCCAAWVGLTQSHRILLQFNSIEPVYGPQPTYAAHRVPWLTQFSPFADEVVSLGTDNSSIEGKVSKYTEGVRVVIKRQFLQ